MVLNDFSFLLFFFFLLDWGEGAISGEAGKAVNRLSHSFGSFSKK